MSLNIKFEYYPRIMSDILENRLKLVKNNKEKWDKPFFTDTNTYLNLEKIKNVSDQFLSHDLKNIIVLGTGGSIQTLLTLKHLSKRKIYPITSSRAVELKKCLADTNPEDSVVIPISRGGETLDVISTIGSFVKNGYKFLGLSSKGTMNEILKRIDCPILDVPDLSGRFAGSISNVGIVPAYFSGINVKDFLNGLEQGYKIYMNFDINPALEFAVFLFELYRKGYKVVFSMPYSKNLDGSVGLFVQEISESSGKEGKGLMGAYQSAPICQHSVLEYLLGGTKGAVIPILWTIENEIPDFKLESSIEYVNGHTAQTIINYQADATFQALLEQSVPSVKITLKNPSEVSIGHLISFIQSAIYYLCLLLNVNWASNPKVVIGKKICNEALKNKASEEHRIREREKVAERNLSEFFS
jgi:glucose-6-phosphate isomerase